MASSNETISMALFCDFENVALGVRDAKYEKFDIKLVLERLLLKGSIVVKKAYCDWERYKSFKGTMHEANFELIEIPHVRQSGKNSADIRLVVDALDLCYTKSHVNTFVIISGDSDFSPLVSKLRENAKQVIGVGVQQSTSDLLIANCDEFIFYDDLVRESQRTVVKREPARPAQQQPAAKRAPDEAKRPKDDLETRKTKAVEIAVQTFDALASERGDSGKIWASVLKNAIKRRKPDFNEAYYGFRAFGNLLEEAQARGLLEFGRDEKSGAYVYRSTVTALGGDQASEPAEPAEDSLPSEAAERHEGGAEQRDTRRRGRGNRKPSRGSSETAPLREEPADGDDERDAPVFGGKVFADEEPEHAQPMFAAQQEGSLPLFASQPEAVETQTSGAETEVEAEATDAKPATGRKGRASRKTAAAKTNQANQGKQTNQAKRAATTPAADVASASAAIQQDAQPQATPAAPETPETPEAPEAPAARKSAARKGAPRTSATRSRRPRKAATATETE
jgi:uncharacterized LabA/DUF88 family protein